MFYLLLAILSSATLSLLMRLSGDRVRHNIAMLFVNYATCLVIAGTISGWGNLFPDTAGLPRVLALGGIQGVLYMVSFVLLQYNVNKNGVVLSTVFMKLGLLVPMLVSVLCFGEMPGLWQGLGFVIALGAIVVINLGDGADGSGFRPMLLLLLVLGGCGDVMAKIFEELGDPALAPQFLLYTFVAALVLCTALMIRKGQRPGGAEVLFGVLLGVPNYFCTKFLLRALETVDAVIAYPTFSVGTLLPVTLVGVLFFRERLSKRQWAAVAAILVALVLLNI